MTGKEIKLLVKKDIKNNYKNRFIIKSETIRENHVVSSISKDITDLFIDLVIATYHEKIIEALVMDDEVKIENLMTLYISKKNRNVFNHPSTGETIYVNGKRHVKVREGKLLLQLINNKNEE